ncbi:MAG: DUF4831 family protein [Clostridium sp.]|nr:DUF4831 family protein [Clostridium sp.]
MMIKSILGGLALCASALAFGQSTTKLTATKANDFGIVYSLPITTLDITIETEITEQTPGELANYAKLCLNIDDAITKPSKSASIKSIVINSRGVPDPDNRWMMQFKAAQPVFVLLNDAEVPLAINTEETAPARQQELPVAQKAGPTPLETPAARQAITQDITMAFNTSKRAQLTAERIFELRQNRNDLISGQADNTPPDGQSMQLALDNLAAQEAALTAMFAGTTRTWTEVSTINFTPSTENVVDMIIARLADDGLVDADDLRGAPVYLSMTVTSRGDIPVDDKGEEKPFPKGGVAYNIPGTAGVYITFDGDEVAAQEFPIAQLGVAYGIDPKMFTDRKAPAMATFDPATGALISLEIK